mgnify:CR=1 FL=1
MADIQLVNRDGYLYYPDNIVNDFGDAGPIVVCVHDAGDCDTIKWPRPHMTNLMRALFDDRETGLTDLEGNALLPHGVHVKF